MPNFSGNQKKTSSDSKRHFTVVMGNKEHGLYISSTPSSAAKKVAKKLCTSNKGKKVEFSLREITQGSKKKVYGPYIGYIEKLKDSRKIVVKKKKLSKKGGMKGGEGLDDIQVSIGDCGKKHSYSTKGLFKKCVILSYGDRRITIGISDSLEEPIQVKYFDNTSSTYNNKEKFFKVINLSKFISIINKLLNESLPNNSFNNLLIIKLFILIKKMIEITYSISILYHPEIDSIRIWFLDIHKIIIDKLVETGNLHQAQDIWEKIKGPYTYFTLRS
jgi:hypothetical protein